MELTGTDKSAKTFAEFLGITYDTIGKIIRNSKPAINKYLSDVIFYDKIGEPEIELFEAFIKNCDTVEEAIFMAFSFRDSVEELLNHSTKNIINQTINN